VGNFLFEQMVNGIITGSMYALIAAGMTMIFGVLRAINFAHGEYYMLGTFGAWYAIEKMETSYAVAIIVGVLIAALISAVIARTVMQRLVGAPFQQGVLATLGVSLILQNAVILAFGGGYKVFNGGWIEPVEVLGVGMAQQRILLIVVALGVFVALEWMVRKTRMGKSIRAVSQNIECCQVNGGPSHLFAWHRAGRALGHPDRACQRQRVRWHGGGDHPENLCRHRDGRHGQCAWHPDRRLSAGGGREPRVRSDRSAIPRHRGLCRLAGHADAASARSVFPARPFLSPAHNASSFHVHHA
jgi:hypothetical protein